MCFNSLCVETLIELIDSYLKEQITASDFEIKYSKKWRECRDFIDEGMKVTLQTQMYIDMVFSTLDCYCSDPLLRDIKDLNDEELYTEIYLLSNSWQKNRCNS
ncbi:colicin immunity domain-containing protein [Ignatzschineria sp. LJL83]